MSHDERMVAAMAPAAGLLVWDVVGGVLLRRLEWDVPPAPADYLPLSHAMNESFLVLTAADDALLATNLPSSIRAIRQPDVPARPIRI